MNGMEVTRQIRARVPTAEILIFTMHDSEVLAGELLRAGARGYLLKSDAKQHLISAVALLANHQPLFYRESFASSQQLPFERYRGEGLQRARPRSRRLADLVTSAVRVAAATNLKFALEELMEAFRQQHPDIRVQITYGSSVKFYPQISNRAPYDMFLS